MLEELHVEIIPTTKTVASVNTLIISLKSVQLSIEPSHKLTIDVP